MIELKSSWQNYIHTLPHIFPKSTTSIIAPIFQPSIWQPVPNSGPKAIRETTILNHPVHPFKSTHYHPPSGSQNRFPDPYSARTSLEFQLKRAFFTEEGENESSNQPPFRSRDTSRGHCARLCYAKPLCAINTGEHPPVLVTAAVYDGRSFPFRRPPWKRRTPLKL